MKNPIQRTIIGLEIVCLVFLFSFSLYGVSSLGTKTFMQQMGLAVGITAGVEKNPINTLAQNLRQKDLALTERERLLVEEESRLVRNGNTQDLSFLIIGFGTLLLFLILLNFYLDLKRKKEDV